MTRFLLVALFLVSACSTTAKVVPYGQFFPRNQKAKVLLEEPDCPNTTIGTITLQMRSGYTVEQYLNDLGEEAAQIGGDAVVGFSNKDFAEKHSFSGTVVRFLDNDCQR